MSALPVRLRCLSHSGSFVISNLTEQSTVDELLKRISLVTGIKPNRLKILSRYPPTPIKFPDRNSTLSALGLRSGDTLHVEEMSLSTFDSDDTLSQDHVSEQGILMKHVVPADNSCLFNSIAFALTGQNQSPETSSNMRKIIAATVSSNPSVYISAILDNRSNDQYCAWILKDTSWGGAIEISILSKYYSIEVVVVDSQSGTLARFGEDSNYQNRILLLYDGIHYDPLVLVSSTGEEMIQTVFPTSDDAVLITALDVAKEAQSARQYVDVKRLPMVCLICGLHLSGPTAAQQHAQELGHSNFKEVDVNETK